MTEPYIGEIRRVAFDFAPRGWALCNGQMLPINQNQALFALLGTVYGGNGVTTFALPDLRGRAPIQPGQGIAQGMAAGAASVTLQTAQLPAHTHGVVAASDAADQTSPQDAYWAATAQPGYGGQATGTMSPGALSAAGGSQPHDNMSPYLAVNYIIAVTGIFPSRD